MKMTVIPFVIGTLGRISKGLVQRLKDFKMRVQAETTKTRPLLKSTRLLRRIMKTWGDLTSLKLQWETVIKNWYENLLKE